MTCSPPPPTSTNHPHHCTSGGVGSAGHWRRGGAQAVRSAVRRRKPKRSTRRADHGGPLDACPGRCVFRPCPCGRGGVSYPTGHFSSERRVLSRLATRGGVEGCPGAGAGGHLAFVPFGPVVHAGKIPTVFFGQKMKKKNVRSGCHGTG